MSEYEIEYQVVDAKDPDVDKTYDLDVFELIVEEALRGSKYVQGDLVRATRDNGFYLECTTAGRTGRYNPYSPRIANQAIRDGSVVWTSRHPDDVTPLEVLSASWTVYPDDLTVDSSFEAGHIATVVLRGGADGCDYEVTGRIVPTQGNTIDHTFIVPVRHK